MDAEIFITFVIIVVAMIVTNIIQSCRISELESDVEELKSGLEEIMPTYSRRSLENTDTCDTCGGWVNENICDDCGTEF